MTLYIAVIAAVVLAMLLTLFTLGLGAAASKPAPAAPPADPWDVYFGGGELPTLADRMTAARDWTPADVDAAFAEIVKEVGR